VIAKRQTCLHYLQLSEYQNNVTSLEHKLTATQQEVIELTEVKKQEVASLQERVSRR